MSSAVRDHRAPNRDVLPGTVPDPPLLRRVCLDTVKEDVIRRVFTITDRAWRGIGVIPASGWRLSPAYRHFDAEHRFDVASMHTDESSICRSGEVLQGLIKPHECEAFGTLCTPRNPLGATMVSSEGACAAYYLYRRLEVTHA